MDFGLLPPEVNSGLMYTGPGAGPLLAAAASWDAVAAELEAAAAGCSSELSGLTGRWWGPSSLRMAAAGTRQVSWLQASAAQAAETAARAYSAVAAYETAYAMTVPPPVIVANRTLKAALVATNFFGQNTPAIAVTEAHYLEMWVQDATAMYTYAADAETASTLQPFDEPSQTTNPNGQTDQANAVSQSTANATSAHTQAGIQQLNSTAALANPSIPPGGSAPVSPGGVSIGQGVTITIGADSPVEVMKDVVLNTASFVIDANGQTYSAFATVPAGTILVDGTFSADGGLFVFPSGGITAGTGGASVTLNATGSVVAINSGAITTSVFIPVAPVVPAAAPAASGLGAVTPLLASPGLAGTAGIQPQLDAEALTEFLSTAATASAGLG
jgi:PPE-repeat protein